MAVAQKVGMHYMLRIGAQHQEGAKEMAHIGDRENPAPSTPCWRSRDAPWLLHTPLPGGDLEVEVTAPSYRGLLQAVQQVEALHLQGGVDIAD